MVNLDYFFGFDIGTDSIGAAVTDTNYNILKYRGNAMWFVKLFDESLTAADRRTFRSGTRRTARKRERIALLQVLFDKEITAIDPAFFQRLKESNLYYEDKSVRTPYAVFSDDNYTDKDFHRNYPTIFHLRNELIENRSKHDIRLVYLALHHLIKHRGHFLFDSLNASDINSFDKVFNEMNTYLIDYYGFAIECENSNQLGDILKDRKLNMTQKYNNALKVCGINKRSSQQIAAVLSLICGKTESAESLYGEKIMNDDKPLKIQLSGDFETRSADYVKALGERFELVEMLKAVYDWSILADVCAGEKYISFAKVKTFEKHKSDLQILKKYVKENCMELYNEIFKISKDKLDNYTAYSKMIKKNGKTGVLHYTCDQEQFCAYLKKIFKKLPQDGYEEMFAEIEAGSFMPKQHIKDNGVIPIQLNRAELDIILKNAAGYLPFLREKDEKGKSVSDKIKDIFNYRIPYYVGPLNRHSNKAWVERKDGKIYPWNFDEMVDTDVSAEKFIANLTSKCTYFSNQDVIPKNAVLYCKYTVLNELNNLRINGEKISVSLKQKIYNDLFLRQRKVTRKSLEKYLFSNGYKDVEITGIDGDFKSTMKPYLDLCEYGISEQEMDSVISAVTIFGDDKKLLRKRLRDTFGGKLNDKDIVKISRLKYSGWGRLSKKFLCEIYSVDPETGEYFNIIEALWKTNDNLMMLLGSKYQFTEKINAELTVDTEQTLKEMVDSLYVSPSVKRPIIQSVKMLNEIVKVLGKAPKKIFVEMTRTEGEKGKREASRKDRLMELYKNCGKDAGELYERLCGTDNEQLRRDKLYLYYTQFGKCMYSGENINFDSLFDNNIYDIDHIYPRSKVKDDSLSNRVLVKKQINAGKDNVYPLSEDIRKKMYGHWKFLFDKGLIQPEKFKRLTRVEPLTDDELSDFIARQIVETSQSTKAVTQILSQLYPDSDIVYVKARNVSEFRQKFDMLKCRAVNDLHHAKDAYLNIVVGNVYDVLYTRNKANFINGLQTKKYSLNQMFGFNIKGAWVSDNNESLNIVKKTMNKNNIIYTRYAFCQHGSLFDINPLKKGQGQVPLTAHGARSDIQKYGGYNRAIATYFTLVRHKGKKNKVCITLQPINLYQVKEFEAEPVRFLQEKCGLTEPEILVKRIKYSSCISIDGFRMHISSKSGSKIVYKSAMQLVLGYQYESYIKNISKYLDKFSERPVNASDKLSTEKNIELFDLITYKMTETILKIKFKDMGEKIRAKRDKFIGLPIEKQCYVLNQVLNILHANVMSGDLKEIGLAGQAGKVTTSMELSGIKGKVKLINQSVTGLFENEYEIK